MIGLLKSSKKLEEKVVVLERENHYLRDLLNLRSGREDTEMMSSMGEKILSPIPSGNENSSGNVSLDVLKQQRLKVSVTRLCCAVEAKENVTSINCIYCVHRTFVEKGCQVTG